MQWDAHDDIDANHEKMCGLTDRPVAALLTDLKRTRPARRHPGRSGAASSAGPRSARRGAGAATTTPPASPCGWPAAASRAGRVVGATDEIGLNAIEDRAHVNDIHATILHLMGLDHKQLTYLHNGRDERLTDVGGRVLKKLLA